jgi:hypothetical protein
MLRRLKSAWPAAEAVLAGFSRPKFARLRLDRFPRGVDNRHIDVALGPVLGRAVANYVRTLVREEVQRHWKQPVASYSESAGEAFRRVTVEHHSAVVRQARSSNQPERAQLFQLALLKQLLEGIDNELAALRAELDDARSPPARQAGGQDLQLHQQAVALARCAPQVRYRVARHLVRELMRLEHASMRQLRKAVLGLSWPVAEVMLANPLLQLDGVGELRDFLSLYPAMLHETETACRANRCVLETFAEWLPASVDPGAGLTPSEQPVPLAPAGRGGLRGLRETERRVRRLFGPRELIDTSASWLDLPENATALLGGDAGVWPRPGQWRHPGITALQRHLNRRLGSKLRRAGLMTAMSASYALPVVYPQLGLAEAEPLVFEFLRGAVDRRAMGRRLAGVHGVEDPAALLRRIDQLRREFEQDPKNGRRQLVARFAGDFLRLRRDLKLAWRLFSGMESVRLVTDERDLALSAANNTLQVFCREDLAADARGSVVGHVIIRVELRGVEEISALMRGRDLSPAAHFSRYFYDPLTPMLDRFEAQKVVVEGDALMLSLLEHGGESAQRLAVARACCLAVQILELSQTMNAEHERLGLPPLELGVGIAYADEPPTFLYDHGRQVTLSPAIDRARRLAACHAPMRRACPMPDGQGLCVAAPVDAGENGEQLVRYNVNGIELEPAAFAQLHFEVSLRRLKMREPGVRQQPLLYAGTCADARGESHPLVVGERPLRLWMGRQLLETEDEGRRYYQVVTDRRLLARVAERLAAAGESLPPPAPRLGRIR